MGPYILDEQGRTLILRGCNLGGNSKYPAEPPGASWIPDSLTHTGDVSFVGRPFPLEEAENHFDRLARWGFTFIRLIITWEALEHGGPGIYDEAYLAYLRKILLIAEKKGVSVYMDPHQDVWSRWTGGDGAPAWTLEKIGIDLNRLDATGAALTHQRRGDPFPRMIWPTNYNRYAAATMFTLFFGGNTYAPETMIDGESAQDWLQERYLRAMRHCFRRLKNCKAITGWGPINEPHQGFIGYRNPEGLENYPVATGPIPSPLQAMAAASGHRVSVPVYTMGVSGPRKRGRQTINPEGLSLFKEGYGCPWKRAGVWTDEGGPPRLLRKDHFTFFNGKPARFVDDFLKPFIIRFAARIREVDEKTFVFIEGIPHGDHPTWDKKDGSGIINAFHWYDGPTLFTKFFRPWISVRSETGQILLGRKRVAAFFTERLRDGRDWTREHMEDMPCLLGEFGLPFDMNGKRAFKTGDYRLHEEALSMYYDAVDNNLLHSTIWNYNADNTHQRGDGWNGEDLSIFHQGEGRAMRGWLRPYPMATAGKPLWIRWDRKEGVFGYRFYADAAIPFPTELYAPPECFGERPEISVRAEDPAKNAVLEVEYRPELRRIFIFHGEYSGEVTLTVSAGKFNGGERRSG
ncbi:MAG: cellulase family glycosylhydrolase [Spirochaetaceae bacterium]|nr:cellulase family glycosylhydrolase [Spirochaetaceae bacterium]